MDLNQPAPDFELLDLQGDPHHLSDYRGKIVILNFWSAECPHSERADQSILQRLSQWSGEVELLSLASNRNESTQMLEQVAKARRLPTVLIDAQHIVADLYEAVTTPHAFLVDQEGILRYRGAVDDFTFWHRQATRFYLDEAVPALLENRVPGIQETTAYGCAIVREI